MPYNELYNLDYGGVVDNILPPNYRKDKTKSFLRSLTSPLQWLRDTFFDNWYTSQDYPFYDGTGFYNVVNEGTKIRFLDNSVWETLVDNVNAQVYNPSIGQTTSGGTQVWRFVQDVHIGFEERSQYNNQKIMMEYLLNRHFKTDETPLANEIYILNYDYLPEPWIIGQTEVESAYVQQNSINSFNYITENDETVDNYDYTIFVPIEITAQLGTNWQDIISNVVDKYNFLSIRYNFITYS